MATVKIEGSNLVVTLSTWEKILTYKGDMVIPLVNVQGATEDPTFMNDSLVFRTRGAIGVPGLFSYGVFAKKGDRIFTSWRRGQNVLVMELKNQKWNRLALGSSSAKQLAREISAKLAPLDPA